jgi:hypothetical protein
MGELIEFPGDTYSDLPVEGVLDGAKDLTLVIVLGWTKDDEFYIASSSGKTPELITLLEIGKHELVELMYE